MKIWKTKKEGKRRKKRTKNAINKNNVEAIKKQPDGKPLTPNKN